MSFGYFSAEIDAKSPRLCYRVQNPQKKSIRFRRNISNSGRPATIYAKTSPPRAMAAVVRYLSFLRQRSADDCLFLFFSFLYDLHDCANMKNSSDLYLIIFARFVAIRMRRNSPVAFSNPRRWCWIHPLFFWSSPCSGSTNPWRFI